METITKETTDTNVEKTTNSESNTKQLVEQIAINDTPFTAIKVGENWFLALGKYRLTNQLNTLEECKAEAQDASWIRIMQIMKIMIQEHELEKQLDNTIREQKIREEIGKIEPNFNV